MGKEIELSTAITDIAAGPFGSNLKVECFVPSGFPIIDGANLKGYKVTDNITKFVTEEKARSLSRSIAHRGDVIVTISGTIGQIAYIPEDSLYDEYLCSQRQFRVSFDSSMVYVPYLVFYFHTFEGQNKILSFANQTGVPALSQPLKNFKKIRLCLPSLQEQRRIASIVETINDKIENNIKINDNLHQQAATLFKALFVDLTPFDGIMPPNWTISTLGDATEMGAGGDKPKESSPVKTPLCPYPIYSNGINDYGLYGYTNDPKIKVESVTVSARGTIGYVSPLWLRRGRDPAGRLRHPSRPDRRGRLRQPRLRAQSHRRRVQHPKGDLRISGRVSGQAFSWDRPRRPVPAAFWENIACVLDCVRQILYDNIKHMDERGETLRTRIV